MRQVAVIALIAALCVARVSAHSWMVSPTSRNRNQAVAGTGPCDAGPATTRTEYNAGDTVTVSYNTGTHGGAYISAIVASANIPSTGSVTQTSPGVIAYQRADLTGPTASMNQHVLTIPSSTPTGDYTIQYWWNNYYNCADIKVINPNSGGLGGGTDGTAPDSSNSTAAAAAGGVIGGLAIAAVILAMAVLYKKGGCRLSSGLVVYPAAASTSTSTASAAPGSAPRPAAARPVASPRPAAPLRAVAVEGAASPRTIAAAVAMNAQPGERPLPPNWDTAVDDNGNVYYYHVHTNQVQWERPVA